jgi:N utilization substance protein B
VNPYTVTLVEGVQENQARIDELLGTYSIGWTLERMPTVDRNLLRIAAYEILYADDVPDTVAISEAVHLASELSTDESAAFVNGLLARLVEEKPSLSV